MIWTVALPPTPTPTTTLLSYSCSYHLHSANFSGIVASGQQSSFAITSSKMMSQKQNHTKISDNTYPTAVNGHKTFDPMRGSQLRVAYLGLPGTYSEDAVKKAYPNSEPIPCDKFEHMFQIVELGVADRAVLPVENSLAGSIHRNYDLLLRHRLHIVGEVHVPIHHCLLALPGVRKENLTRVISHPQALAQCELTLTKLGLINVAREAMNNLRDTAGIASARAAEHYGLKILEDGIRDDPRNVTRFVMLAREPNVPGTGTDTPFKTSICFTPYKGKTVLYKVLSAFACRDVGLMKMEIRPHKKCPIWVVDDVNVGTIKYFEYVFYVDFEASMAEIRAQNAIAEVEKLTKFLRVFGSYPMDTTPWCPIRENRDRVRTKSIVKLDNEKVD
ncbi:hypothetical protein HHK36_019285 [Tetracentron sinense]|uniref:Prephenate dehydratase domain-containing protein n=1 Tax=Tetracentron sinense TaxID=13715 RepID=A0A834YXA3_TETSI|nr:hypothetical protein HHK36_019285 [Tetracentron sinense]